MAFRSSFALSLASWMLFGNPASGQIEFDTARYFQGPDRAGTVKDFAAGDLDEDGDLEIVGTANEILAIWTNQGQGRFDSFEFDVPGDPRSVEICDLDGDGHLDIIAGLVNAEPTTLAILLGDGNLGFPRRRYLEGGDDPFVLEVGDLTGDGRPEIVTGNADQASLSIFLQRRLAFFEEEIRIPGVGAPDGIVLSDLDEDGNTDIAVSRNRLVLELLFGDGEGEFRQEFLSVPRFSASVRAGDFNRDPHVDLVVTNPSDSSATVMLGDGRGGFSAQSPLPTEPIPNDLVVMDFNRDGRSDLVTCHLGSRKLSLLEGRAVGFAPMESFCYPGRGLRSIEAYDIDNDGIDDLVGNQALGNPFSGLLYSIFVLPGQDVGRFANPFSIAIPYAATPTLRTADLNEDGHQDVVVFTNSGIHFLAGDGSGQLATPVPTVSGARTFELADWNGDSHLDIIGYENPTFYVHCGDGTGQFPTTFQSPLSFFAPDGIRVGDFDEDGFPDALVFFESTEGSFVSLYFSDGSCGIREERGMNLGDIFIHDLVIGDFNEDLHLDMVISGGGVYFGDGNGGLTRTLGGIPNGFHLHAMDFDDDGHLDLLAGNNVQQSILRGTGSGTFTTVPGPYLAYGSMAYRAADLDGDGIKDLYGWDEDSDDGVYTSRGLGLGAVENSVIWFASGQACRDATHADFDEDGLNDLATLNLGNDTVTILLNCSLDSVRCRVGTVNSASGPITDVLFINGSAGQGDEKIVTAGINDPITVFLDSPPSRTGMPTRYVLYGKVGCPSVVSPELLPFGLGRFCIDTPLSGGSSDMIFNTVGREPLVGTATHPSARAPSDVLVEPSGFGAPMKIFFQGVIIDPGSAHGRAAITNGVLLEVN